jgi:hypothetical protein
MDDTIPGAGAAQPERRRGLRFPFEAQSVFSLVCSDVNFRVIFYEF